MKKVLITIGATLVSIALIVYILFFIAFPGTVDAFATLQVMKRNPEQWKALNTPFEHLDLSDVKQPQGERSEYSGLSFILPFSKIQSTTVITEGQCYALHLSEDEGITLFKSREPDIIKNVLLQREDSESKLFMQIIKANGLSFDSDYQIKKYIYGVLPASLPFFYEQIRLHY